MTEAEWMACADPTPMLDFLRGHASDRKLRLFACADRRRFWADLRHEASRAAVEAAERFADGLLTAAELAVAEAAAWEAQREVSWEFEDELARLEEVERLEDLAAYAAAAAAPIVSRSSWASGPADAAQLLRELIGNPFRTGRLAPAWLAWNDGAIRKMAQAVYDDRAFADLSLLADALEEAGCADAAILMHCRQPGEHVRGCWVVDLLLGKTSRPGRSRVEFLNRLLTSLRPAIGEDGTARHFLPPRRIGEDGAVFHTFDKRRSPRLLRKRPR